MLQRIQTIFLFIAFVITGLFLFFPAVNIIADNKIFQFYFYGIIDKEANRIFTYTIPFAILACIIPLISLITIFLFRRRIIQIKLCIINIILLAGTDIMLYFYSSVVSAKLNGTVHYLYTVILPAIAIILILLAIRAIRKDEKLVKSVDRIR
ncbi:MAG: DUF4293 domain-containing protein [Bacteroidia bacterium]|nr:DUF4293 domain-containing protein [Bacteroidia bacterium]